MPINDLSGLRVTVMGLGLHGGGLTAAVWMHGRGATVTVTDLRSETVLRPSLDQLPTDTRTVIGTHEVSDFSDADLVIKNPAVPRHAPVLSAASAVTTDIALFLWSWSLRLGDQRGPLVAITGTKGKSGTSSAAAHILAGAFPGTRLGGNITVSPLLFVDELGPGDPVVLELSSFQLGDIAWCRERNRQSATVALPDALIHPVVPADVSVITNIYRDHQDYYDSMETYVKDKREIYQHVRSGGTIVLSATNDWSTSFRRDVEARATDTTITVMTEHDAPAQKLLPESLQVPGEHSRTNVAMAALCAASVGVPPQTIRDRAASFPGIPHRLEIVARARGITWINDSAATIPEAALAAVRACTGPVILIAGGSDKGLDPAPIVEAASAAHFHGGGVILIDGTATPMIVDHLLAEKIPWEGPFSQFSEAIDAAGSRAKQAQNQREHAPSDRALVTVLLSPGCASFGMFRNEFDRGDQFRAYVVARA